MTCTVSRPWMEMSLARQNSVAVIFFVDGKEEKNARKEEWEHLWGGAGSHGAQDGLELYLSTAFTS